MQSLYAYNQCKRSDYWLSLDKIKESFSPDPETLETSDPEEEEQRKSTSINLFEKSSQEEHVVEEEIEPEIIEVTQKSLTYYHEQAQKDFRHLFKTLILETEKIQERYITLLFLLVEFGDLNLVEYEKKEKSLLKSSNLKPVGLNLYHNRFISAIRDHNSLGKKVANNSFSWNTEKGTTSVWYKDFIKADPVFVDYQKKQNPDWEDDRSVLKHLIRKVLFKNKSINAYLEEKDLNWAEDKNIVKSTVLKTMADFGDAGPEPDFELPPISQNWEEDREFLEELFKLTVKKDQEYEKLISQKAKNWDVDRIAVLDKIILKMAICEMINFTNIPIKVTINEYIEISKIYSTPKSRHFINGILDVVARDLKEKGVIKKSGKRFN